MRGILECWLKQADKVEKFKHSQIWKNALHVKFHLVTGDVVTKDEEYEHLQVTTLPDPTDRLICGSPSQLVICSRNRVVTQTWFQNSLPGSKSE